MTKLPGMTQHWCIKFFRCGFFFRLNGYGLRLMVGTRPLYFERKLHAERSRRVWWLGSVRLLILTRRDLNGKPE